MRPFEDSALKHAVGLEVAGGRLGLYVGLVGFTCTVLVYFFAGEWMWIL